MSNEEYEALGPEERKAYVDAVTEQVVAYKKVRHLIDPAFMPPPLPVQSTNRIFIVANSILGTIVVSAFICLILSTQMGEVAASKLFFGVLFLTLFGYIANRVFHWLQRRGLDSKASGLIILVTFLAYSTTLNTRDPSLIGRAMSALLCLIFATAAILWPTGKKGTREPRK